MASRKKTTSSSEKKAVDQGRYIPEEVRRQLREEVGFGCPIKNCGSPYLSYHHFDPPYHIEKHHKPEGMIALCLHHHKAADNGAYSTNYLRNLKKYPYLKTVKQKPKGRFEWERENLVVFMGGTIYIDNDVILQVKGKNIIWISQTEYGYDNLNLDVYSQEGRPLFVMRDNDWLIHEHFSELICPPCGNSINLKVKAQGIVIDLKFYQLLKEKLHQKLGEISIGLDDEDANLIKNFVKENEFALCKVNLSLVYPSPLLINKSAVINRSNGNTISGLAIVKAPIALAL